jgi:hypothetical protein
VQTAAALRPASKPQAQPAPAEWRINRTERKPITTPSVDPLIACGRQFRPDAAFHKPHSPLPLFDYAQRVSAERDEQVLVERVVGVLLKRMGG